MEHKKQKLTDIENKLVLIKGGERQIRTMGLTDTKYYLLNRQATMIYYIAQGTLPIIL